jgi:hypothetical protein
MQASGYDCICIRAYKNHPYPEMHVLLFREALQDLL